MAMSGEVTVVQNGGNAKLHPYIIALVRWCVDCVRSTATLVLHRLLTGQLPPVIGLRPTVKPRPAGKDHLHPEPKVDCQVLYQPEVEPKMDVIFVHGLYGSLGNTWRQGDWRSKYKTQPDTVPLRRAASHITQLHPCDCQYEYNNKNISTDQDDKQFHTERNKSLKANEFTNIDEEYYRIKSIPPNDNMFITENFYRDKVYDQVEIIDNYETHAKFVSDLFKIENECDKGSDCDFQIIDNNVNNLDDNIVSNEQYNYNNSRREDDQIICSELNGKANNVSEEDSEAIDVFYECQCKRPEVVTKKVKNCEVGCGCVCDDCYSPCWPRDWIKEDYPDARVISINYTSDPYLWRPLWVKEIKRLRLHERADQMTRQLLDLGVGERPIIWVGHSKGGLFIKQIYCEAYEAHKKMNEIQEESEAVGIREKSSNTTPSIENSIFDSNKNISHEKQNKTVFDAVDGNGNKMKAFNARTSRSNTSNNGLTENEKSINETSRPKEDTRRQASLWSASCGFMFYSVPHRGSPLADFKTPLTARSVELLEISKDCSLVLSLQERWLGATSTSLPVVRSLVETCRTLMSVFWLRIVSVDSADPGIGALCGISLDHREICKPSSRRCTLYKELMNLIHAALNRCRCSDS